MKEEEIKKLVSKSKVETSYAFLNTLMQKVEAEALRAEQKKSAFPLGLLIAVCSILIVVITFISFMLLNETFESNNLKISNLSTPVFVVSFGVLLYVLNNFIRTCEVSLDG